MMVKSGMLTKIETTPAELRDIADKMDARIAGFRNDAEKQAPVELFAPGGDGVVFVVSPAAFPPV